MNTPQNYTNHFALQSFITYQIDKQQLRNDLYAVYMLEKLATYATKHQKPTRDSLAYFLMDTVPELEYAEAVAFCEDEILTEDAQEIKRTFWRQGGQLPDPEKALNDYCVLQNGKCELCKYKGDLCHYKED